MKKCNKKLGKDNRSKFTSKSQTSDQCYKRKPDNEGMPMHNYDNRSYTNANKYQLSGDRAHLNNSENNSSPYHNQYCCQHGNIPHYSRDFFSEDSSDSSYCDDYDQSNVPFNDRVRQTNTYHAKNVSSKCKKKDNKCLNESSNNKYGICAEDMSTCIPCPEYQQPNNRYADCRRDLINENTVNEQRNDMACSQTTVANPQPQWTEKQKKQYNDYMEKFIKAQQNIQQNQKSTCGSKKSNKVTNKKKPTNQKKKGGVVKKKPAQRQHRTKKIIVPETQEEEYNLHSRDFAEHYLPPVNYIDNQARKPNNVCIIM